MGDMKQCAIVASDRALGEPLVRIHPVRRFRNKKTHPGGCFSIPEWLGMRDSNPRMVGPEPTALPLGESPTVPFILDHLFKFVNPHHFCQITNFIV